MQTLPSSLCLPLIELSIARTAAVLSGGASRSRCEATCSARLFALDIVSWIAIKAGESGKTRFWGVELDEVAGDNWAGASQVASPNLKHSKSRHGRFEAFKYPCVDRTNL